MTEEQTRAYLLDRGDSAYTTLTSPIMRLALDEVQTDIIKGWAHSEPKEAKAREDAYNMIRLIPAVLDKLKEYANIAISIREADAAAARDADDDDDNTDSE